MDTPSATIIARSQLSKHLVSNNKNYRDDVDNWVMDKTFIYIFINTWENTWKFAFRPFNLSVINMM